ncbi:hypothetical protein EOL73_02595 [Candidatus Saccharibacteria bacterium]|nr:hypothetical protein [Candidatus Saccharibacteria bacterium]
MKYLRQSLTERTKSSAKILYNSIWLFPVILTVIFILLVSLKLHGSSLGIYHGVFYGVTKDSNLIFGKPRAIRSDEWVVNTQLTLAQANAGFPEINKNLGEGTDMSLLIDAPYFGWTQLFKPHNWSFFILPFDYAFSFKWWVMGYFLILSVYFFCLTLLPRHRGIATILSLSVFFSPFIQWWYQFITLAPFYYSLFAATLFVILIKSTSTNKRFFVSASLAYVLVCFAMVQYPPFQIACALVLMFFVLGYTINNKKILKGTRLKRSFIYSVSAVILAVSLVSLFVYQKKDSLIVIANTAYPGERIVRSGGYNLQHLLAGIYSAPLQSDSRANNYRIPSANAFNQSESSNFILLMPFLLIPALYVMYKRYRKERKVDYLLISIIFGFVGCLIWLLVPGLDLVGSLTFLDKVPHPRLLIGLGLLNITFLIVFMGYRKELRTIRQSHVIAYSILVWVLLLYLGWWIHSQFPLYLAPKILIGLSVTLPIIIYLFLRTKFLTSLSILLAVSIASTVYIHPLYRGTELLTHTNLVSEIKSTNTSPGERWILEDSLMQSFAFMSGKESITGIYQYPQINLWRNIEPTPDPYTYNRYAHVNFVLDKDPNTIIQTKFSTHTGDHFSIDTEPCGELVESLSIKYFVTTGILTKDNAPCTTLVKSVYYPATTFNIYRLTF